MKKIAIIGTGISGLRAAFELAGNHEVSLFEKSSSVGGRIATRRFENTSINHGASNFDGIELLEGDPLAQKLKEHLSLLGAATELPKAMRDLLQPRPKLSFHFKTKISHVNKDLTIEIENGETLGFDEVIITAPVPQARELLREKILPEITYTKQISFIGMNDSGPVKWMLSEDDSDKIFDESEETIRAHADRIFGSTAGLDCKKWRYSRVHKGYPNYFFEHTNNIFICGDAFNPQQTFHLGSAWRSGLMTARRVL